MGTEDHVDGKISTGTVTSWTEDNWAHVQWRDGDGIHMYKIGTEYVFIILGMYLKLYIKSKNKYIITSLNLGL